jgi:CspA family cold shock protein
MGKGRDYRGPRRRGFDDDVFPPPDEGDAWRGKPSFSAPPAVPVTEGSSSATVKWFNAEKGFGFVELADGSGDAFLHAAVLRTAGHDSVEPGTKMRVQVGRGQKGHQITAVLELDTSTAVPAPARTSHPGAASRQRPDASTATEISGTVKWFNAEKGFGFVMAEDAGKDIFVHISVLDKAGLKTLAEGQRVSMRVVQGQKGREAITISAAS